MGLGCLVVWSHEIVGGCGRLVFSPRVVVGSGEGTRLMSSCITATVDDVVNRGELGRGGAGVLDTGMDE